ncbi:hypothetical protein BDQ17DRAFT_1436665 [Cyathus striatus]|nr:hypothetical protein BDQ17DRAFT_1436665 [Cyathus striatus]
MPDLLVKWPYMKIFSRHYTQVIEESDRWVESLRLFTDEGMRAYRSCNISLLGALLYSSRDHKGYFHYNLWFRFKFNITYFIRLGCDFVNVLFVIDEYTDVADEEMTTKIMNSICKYLSSQDPMSIEPNDIIEKMAQQLWDPALKMAPPLDNGLQKSMDTMKEYLQSRDQSGGFGEH